ncbi:helix-turn-helix transcriptional regulator [Bacillus toyonensis]|uniref:helix-turn-helix domain-containing protein n=1 Tax=Bacillus toyonensis TaxID=155322 RepID=UPI003467D8F2
MKCIPEQVTNLRFARENRGISMNQFSKELKIPCGVIQAIETGKKSTIASRAMIIAQYYNLPLDELFTPTYYKAKQQNAVSG